MVSILQKQRIYLKKYNQVTSIHSMVYHMLVRHISINN